MIMTTLILTKIITSLWVCNLNQATSWCIQVWQLNWILTLTIKICRQPSQTLTSWLKNRIYCISNNFTNTNKLRIRVSPKLIWQELILHQLQIPHHLLCISSTNLLQLALRPIWISIKHLSTKVIMEKQFLNSNYIIKAISQ